MSADVRRLSGSLTQLAGEGRTDTEGTLQQAVRVVDERFETLRSAVDEIEQTVTSVLKKKMNYDHNREMTVTWLRGLDDVLKTVEELSPAEPQRCAVLKVRVRSRCNDVARH